MDAVLDGFFAAQTPQSLWRAALECPLDVEAYADLAPEVRTQMRLVREAFVALVDVLDSGIPECPEKLQIFAALEAAALWAMKALVLTAPPGGGLSAPQRGGGF